MIKFAKAAAAIFTSAIITVTAGAGYIYSQRDALIKKVAATAADYATEMLGTKIEIGDIVIGDINSTSNSDLTVKNFAIYDKNSELIAKAETANINFKLLNLYNNPLSAIDEINITNVEGNVKKRADGTWNFNDIKTTGGGESKFDANINIDKAKVNAEIENNKITADVKNLNLDFDTTADFSVQLNEATLDVNTDEQNINVDVLKADAEINHSNIQATVNAKTLGSSVNAKAKVSDDKQIINIDADELNIEDLLPFIPEGTIPAGLTIHSGKVKDTKINVLRRGENLSFSGNADLNNGSVTIEQTDIDNINGKAQFTDAEILVSADLTANGQQAQLNGSIRIDTDEPYFNLYAKSDSFNPNAVMYLPAEGTASFNAHLTGTVSNPIVEADINSPYISYENMSVSNVSTHLKYQNDAVYLSDLNASVLGGTIIGEAELQAMDLSYNAHVKLSEVNAAQLSTYIPKLNGINGLLFGDIGINGVSDDLNQLKLYGSAMATNVVYNNAIINRADVSFSTDGDDAVIDYMNIDLPNHGNLGLEGTVTDGNKLDFKFYGSHFDLSTIKSIIPQVEISGLADFKGNVHGNADNPDVQVNFSAVDSWQVDSEHRGNHYAGILFDQPYDSIKFNASGSLDGVEVNDFKMVRNGKDVWLVAGKVGLTGEKKIDLRVDTVGARAEDIIRLVAPDQDLTGNVDNVITVTGTLDKPNVVGYIHFWRGSYRGMLVNGMDGDYYVDGNNVRLQDFHIFSPMVDMTLNGTIDSVTTDMNFIVEVKDIDVHRFESKLPKDYPANGHGKFSGTIKGNLDRPIFDGKLIADTLNFNGVDITEVEGHLMMNGSDIFLSNFAFNSDGGRYEVHGKVNYETNAMSGRSEVHNADIAGLCALANLKNELIDGKLDSDIQFSGTLQYPAVHIVGIIPKGTCAGADIHDISVNLNLLNNVLYVNKLEGMQGENGTINVSGSANLNGPIDLKLSANNLELAMFGRAAGIDQEFIGTASIEANIGGSVDNPAAYAEISATGGIKGSTFDLLKGNFELANGIVKVNELSVQRTLGEKLYKASAKGLVPLISLSAKNSMQLKNDELINLDISLDNADLSLLPVLSDYVSWAIGEMQGTLKITGTAANPMINGKIAIPDGTTKIKGVSSLIEHQKMLLAFKGNRIDVETFTGQIGNGHYDLTGGISFSGITPTNYNFKFTADKLGIKSTFFNGPLTMEFTLNDEETRFGKFPKFAGYIDIDKCSISVPSIPESEGELPTIIMDVSVNLGDKVHFYTPYLYDMYVRGKAEFRGTTTHPRPSGTFNVKRGGTLNYLKTVFNIREGEAHFNQPDSFFPTIKLSADARLTNTRIYLEIDGSLKDRSMKLTSSPEMSETEIINLLTLRDAYQKGKTTEITAGDLLSIGLQMSLMSEIESAVRRTFGFDYFTVSRGSGSAFDNRSELRDRSTELEYNVSMGKYVTDKVMLRYTRGIGGDNINRYGMQYDLNDNIGITAEREGHDFIFGIEARWKF